MPLSFRLLVMLAQDTARQSTQTNQQVNFGNSHGIHRTSGIHRFLASIFDEKASPPSTPCGPLLGLYLNQLDPAAASNDLIIYIFFYNGCPGSCVYLCAYALIGATVATLVLSPGIIGPSPGQTPSHELAEMPINVFLSRVKNCRIKSLHVIN